MDTRAGLDVSVEDKIPYRNQKSESPLSSPLRVAILRRGLIWAT
jgi:hypothetical protein